MKKKKVLPTKMQETADVLQKQSEQITKELPPLPKHEKLIPLTDIELPPLGYSMRIDYSMLYVVAVVVQILGIGIALGLGMAK